MISLGGGLGVSGAWDPPAPLQFSVLRDKGDSQCLLIANTKGVGLLDLERRKWRWLFDSLLPLASCRRLGNSRLLMANPAGVVAVYDLWSGKPISRTVLGGPLNDVVALDNDIWMVAHPSCLAAYRGGTSEVLGQWPVSPERLLVLDPAGAIAALSTDGLVSRVDLALDKVAPPKNR